MNPEQLQQVQTNQVDTTALGGLSMDGMMQQLETVLLYGTIASVAILIPFLLLYVLSSRRKSKAYKAIIEIQKTLHEMNERDKARNTHPASDVNQPPITPAPAGPIAHTEPTVFVAEYSSIASTSNVPPRM